MEREEVFEGHLYFGGMPSRVPYVAVGVGVIMVIAILFAVVKS